MTNLTKKIQTPNGSIYFPLVFHLHQPVGQFQHVFEEAYNRSYNPLLQALERHPKTKAAFHITGVLLEWFEREKPEYINRIRTLVKRGQLELITGGYYEPIFAIIPHEDKIKQIKKLSNKIKELFGVTPEGMWLAERAWEPHLPAMLHEAGVKYIFIDDNHVQTAGIDPPRIHHVFVTEEDGKSVVVFPINGPVRYLVPWKPIEQCFNYLASQVDAGDDSLVITSIDDAEKLGLWPAGKDRTTYDICYVDGHSGTPYIDEWFGLIESLPWVKSITPGEYYHKHKPQGIIYLPSTSYDKMGVWVLPPKKRREIEYLQRFAKEYHIEKLGSYNISKLIQEYAKGGFWRQFLVKYPEANLMHKRMYHARRRLQRALEEKHITPTQYDELMDHVLAAQCNDPYWHGQFGGVYYMFMRGAIYRELIQAHVKLDSLVKPKYPLIETYDMTYDGHDEVIYEDNTFLVVFSTKETGSIIELDHKPTSNNLLNLLTRREESYHKSPLPPIDLWMKTAFREFQLNTNALEAYYANPASISRNNVNLTQYDNVAISQDKKEIKFNGMLGASTITKTYYVHENTIHVEYEGIPVDGHVELAFVLDDAFNHVKYAITTSGSSSRSELLELMTIARPHENVTNVHVTTLSNAQPDVDISISVPAIIAIGSVSPSVLSESTFEPSYQGIQLIITPLNVTRKFTVEFQVTQKT